MDNDKLRFLVVSPRLTLKNWVLELEKRKHILHKIGWIDWKISFNNIAVISLNKLLTVYEEMSNNRTCDRKYWIEVYDDINFLYFRYKSMRHNLYKAYRSGDAKKLKKLLTGDCYNDVEIYMNEAILGVRDDGVQVKAVATGDNTVEFIEEFISEDLPVKSSNSLRLKFELAGIDFNIASYDCGDICYDGRFLKHAKFDKCIGIISMDNELTGKGFRNVYIKAHIIVDSDLEAKGLIHSVIDGLHGSTLRVQNVLFTSIDGIMNSTIKIDNMRSSVIMGMKNSIIEIDNAYNVILDSYAMADSKLKFNCNFNSESLSFKDLSGVDRVEFIFTKSVDMKALEGLIKHLERPSNSKSSFMIKVNTNVYAECIKELKGKHMNYISSLGD